MIDSPGPHLLIVGVTTRALAVSAARAGYRVTAVDGFGDLDLRAVADVITVRSVPGTGFNPHAAAAAGAALGADLVAYTSNLENHPRAVARLASGRRLLGNSPEALTRVRNPIELMRALRRCGFDAPKTRGSPPADSRSTWMLKPRRSGGGHGVSVWQHGFTVPRSSYVQERIEGTPGSIVFAANGCDSVILGVSRQLVGDVRFGSHGFRYCGSLLASRTQPVFPHQKKLLDTAGAIAAAMSREFGLVGLNGIDFIARGGVPYPVELNPRYSASMELVERAHGVSMFEVHARACQGELPDPLPLPVMTHGKAIVFARRDLVLGDTRPWLGRESFGDVPRPGERIGCGRPICTVFATAHLVSGCMKLLVRRAGGVYRLARPISKRAA